MNKTTKLSANFQRVMKRFGFNFTSTVDTDEIYTNKVGTVIFVKHFQDWKIVFCGNEIGKGTGSPDLEKVLTLTSSSYVAKIS